MGYDMQQRDYRFLIRLEHAGDVFEALRGHIAEELRDASHLGVALQTFNWVTDESYSWIWFTDDRYFENYPVLFEILAPFIVSGCWIEMQGQEGEIWRWDSPTASFSSRRASSTGQVDVNASLHRSFH